MQATNLPHPQSEQVIDGANGAANALPAPSASGEENVPEQGKQMVIGSIRSDLQFIPPGKHGNTPMLYDPLSEVYYKLSTHTCNVMRLMDKPYEFAVLLQRCNEAGLSLDKEELLEIISFMDQNSLFAPEYGKTDKKFASYQEMMKQSQLMRLASVYLFFKLPPIYPDKFFTSALPFAKLFFNRFTITFLTLFALLGYILLVRQWNEAYALFLNSLSWSGLVNYFWALLITKSVHELSHGFTAKIFGAKVRAMGVSFIVFYPRLFVDLTDTWRLPRYQRLLCDSAGIISELLFGGIAAAIWVYSPPGPMKSTMFYLFTVSTLGTILVNGNPFIRYDGYYILTDILNIENLMSRSTEYLKAVNRKLFFGIGTYPDAGDCSGLALYLFGASAFIYRIFLYTSIILLVYFQFTFAKPLAIFLMFMEVYTMVIMPIWKEMRTLAHFRKKVSVIKSAFSLLLISGVVFLFFIPLPWSLDLPCEIVPEDKSLVAVDEGAFASERLEEEPQKVKKGSTILSCNSPLLDFSLMRSSVAVKRDTAELELVRADSNTMGSSPVVFERLKANRLYLKELERRKMRLNVPAPADGIFFPVIKDVVPGRWLAKGTLLGFIVSPQRKVIAYARDNEVNKLVKGDPVTLRLRDSLEEYRGKVEGINPVAVKFRDSTLIQQMGGFIACFPDMKTKEFTPVNVLYAVSINMDKPMQCPYGRTGIAEVEKKYILALEISRTILHVFFREFSF